MANKKSTLTLSLSWDASKATILSAMQHLVAWPDGARVGHIDDTAFNEIDYLMKRLSLTCEQVMILSAICAYNASRMSNPCDMGDISEMLNLHPLEALSHQNVCKQLEDLGYIYYTSDMNEGWLMEPKALQALKENRPLSWDELQFNDNMEFLSEAHKVIKQGMCHDSRNTIVPALRRMMERNMSLGVVVGLNNLHASKMETWAMLLFMTTLGIEGDDYVSTRDLEQILRRPDAQRLLRAFGAGNHPFVTNGWVEPYGGDGMAHAERWVLSREGWMALVRNEEDVNTLAGVEEQDGRLTSYKSLVAKELFFTDKTQAQVSRLHWLLEDNQYQRIHQALKEQGMPTGFCCLFYGTPGTGKTECVQQLAIATGRDIMQVDIATLRDKYVGESEKRLQSIFSTYRALVQKQAKAPILFFNEADAIFGNRMENTHRSVDKMENALQNIILQEMESLDGILICTTNLTSNMDKAFDRRFLYKVEFERPSNEARRRIWKSLLSDLTDEQANVLAEKYDFSGGQILNISRKQIINRIFCGSNDLDFHQIQEDCQAEKLSRNNGRQIGF